MSKIFFDTNLFIYLLEDERDLAEQVRRLIVRMESRGDKLVTSALTFGEVLVRPTFEGNHPLIRAYERLFSSADITVIPYDRSAAKCYAKIRGDRTIKPPDAIQLACASALGVDLFIANDLSLTSKNVQGIQFIVGLQSAPL